MAEAPLGWFGGTSVEDTRWCQGMAVIMTSSGSDGWPGGQVVRWRAQSKARGAPG